MAVKSFQFAERELYRNQIYTLTHSQALHNAESLCKLLNYLSDHTLDHPGVALKEYQIATEVFGRPASFDPQADSAVRVQVGRLRNKLLEYYSHEGLGDKVIVEMPKGVYALQFRYREASGALDVGTPVVVPASASSTKPLELAVQNQTPRGWIITVWILSAALAVALAVIVTLLAVAHPGRGSRNPDLKPAAALSSFWHPFVSSPEAPWIIFSNAPFVGRPETGMRYMQPGRDSGSAVLDHYTGVGEVLAIHDLDDVFHLLDHPIRIKRGSLFSLDDANSNDLIFVGSPAENLNLRDLPGTQEFVFKRLDSSPHKGDLVVVNAHPEPGQPSVFYPSDSTQPLVEDYSIVALLHGLNPARHVMILAGTTTIGTQAAVAYVCKPGSVAELLRRLGVQSSDEMRPFEALLRVKVARGVPVGVELVAVRSRP